MLRKPVGATPEQLEENNLEWVLVGGLSIGMKTEPQKWVLRNKNAHEVEKQKAKLLQQNANLARKLHYAEVDIIELLLDIADSNTSPEVINILNKYLATGFRHINDKIDTEPNF
jgi:hypothetical protein